MAKTLHITAHPSSFNSDTWIDVVYGGRALGSLALHSDDFADFIEGLRAGFSVVAEQKEREAASFSMGLPDADDPEDD